METNLISKELLEAIVWEIASKPGNIITFNENFPLVGIKGCQVGVEEVEIDRKTKAFRMKGLGRDTPWFRSVRELTEALDLDFMSRQHNVSFPDPSIPCLFYEAANGNSKAYCNIVNSIRKDGKIYYEDIHTGSEYNTSLENFIKEYQSQKIAFLTPPQYDQELKSVIRTSFAKAHEDFDLLMKKQNVSGNHNPDVNPLYDREYTDDFMEALEEGPLFNSNTVKQADKIYNEANTNNNQSTSADRSIKSTNDILRNPFYALEEGRNAKEPIPPEQRFSHFSSAELSTMRNLLVKEYDKEAKEDNFQLMKIIQTEISHLDTYQKKNLITENQEHIHSPINTTNMATQTLASSAVQQEQIDKILKDLEFKGFKADFHKENITKAVNENKSEFSLKDQSFSKKVDFTLTYSRSPKGYYNLSVIGHHKELGTFAKFPLNNAFPRKDVFENFLEGRAFLTNIDKWKDGQPVGKDSVWLTMKENPCKSAADTTAMWNHTKSYDHKFFSIKDEFFGHTITPAEKKDLEKGRLVTFNDCVDLTTGEIQIVAGIHANPGKQKLNYSKPEPTGQFLDQDKLASLNERIQKKDVAQKPEPEEEKKKVNRKKI